MLLSDRTTGIAVAALGVAAFYGGSLQPPVPGQQVGPSVFPMVIGTGLVVCGILIALGVGRSFEEAAEADLGTIEGSREATAAAPPPPLLAGLRALLPPALLLFYVLAVDPLGFVLTAGLMVLAMVLAFRGSWRLAAILTVAAPLAIHLVFYKLLRVPLPEGLLTPPW